MLSTKGSSVRTRLAVQVLFMDNRIKYKKELLEEVINSSNSVKECLTKLGIETTNGTSTSFYKSIKKYNLDIKHFSNVKPFVRYKNKDLFKTDSKASRSTLKNKILKENLIPYFCSYCGCDENWMGKKMPLILDHINGVNNDNRLENLRFLCSNCDSIQDTYKNRNKNISKRKETIRKKIEYKNKILENKQKRENHRIFIIHKILNSNIDFSKKTWGVELSKILNKSPQYCLRFVKKYMKDCL